MMQMAGQHMHSMHNDPEIIGPDTWPIALGSNQLIFRGRGF